MDPSQLKLLILTHGDFDHIGSAAEVRQLTGAAVAIHKADKQNLEESLFNWPPGVTVWGRMSRYLFKPFLQFMRIPPVKADIDLNDSDFSLHPYGIDGKIVHTPGHTAGSVSVVLSTGVAFIGCLAHNGFPFRLRPGLPIYAEDMKALRHSWNLIISQGAKYFYPGHGNGFDLSGIPGITNPSGEVST
jgi:glyoxylase-like metal-dependent hydrolase (beta-lactamase superfamily II)